MQAGPDEIAEAVRRLGAGRLVAFPTETVYGLGADAWSGEAVARVFAAKGRPSNNPLIVHVSGEAMARRVSGDWPEAASRLARAFWPGPLSIIVPRGARIAPSVTAGGSTMAVRCPDHPITLALIEAYEGVGGGPLVGPSANVSGGVSPTTAGHVREAFTPEEVFVLDGGACVGGIESTVVAVTQDGAARVLRPGLVTAEEVARVLRKSVVMGGAGGSSDQKKSGVLESPGLLEVHYAPKTRAVLVGPERWEEVMDAVRLGRAVVLTATPRGETGTGVLVMPGEARAYAARLYAALREADAMGVGTIYVEAPASSGMPGNGDLKSDDEGVWRAVMDRLKRATARG
jgi:L-threonylcarbamoyladenylate synthase